MRHFFVALLFCSGLPIKPHGQSVDSLISLWRNEQLPDSVRFKAMDDLTWNTYLFTLPDSAILFSREHWNYALKSNNKKQVSVALNTIGVGHYIMSSFDSALYYFNLCLDNDRALSDHKRIGADYNNIGLVMFDMTEFDSAMHYYNESMKIAVQINDQSGIAGSYNNVARVYQEQGNFSLAIINYTTSLKIKERLGDKPGIARAYNNIGSIYHLQKQHTQAIAYFEKSLAVCYDIEDDYQIAGTYINISNAYAELGMYDSAMSKCLASLKLREEMQDVQGQGQCYATLGMIHQWQGNKKSARTYFEQSLKLREQAEDLAGMATSLNYLGELDLIENNYSQSISRNEAALQIALENSIAQVIKDASLSLYKGYKKIGKLDKSLEMYELHIKTRDSIYSQTNQQEITRQEYKYKYEKQAAADSVFFIKQQEVDQAQIEKQNAEISKRRNQQYALVAGLILILIFSAFIYNRFKLTQRQKLIIEDQKKIVEAQKELVEERSKEVLDSINYARRLQQAILPSGRRLTECLPNHFILYQPKDIVAGDFYWVEKHGDSVFFAAADCTGHGVPGALVSVVCSNALHRTLKEFGITEPGKMLDRVRELVVETFSKNETEVKDGMDISLCVYHEKKNELQWSGANNPLWLVRNNELIEYKPNKQPVGFHSGAEPFSTHIVPLEKNDILYLFTDGYQDQFGGDKGKKFKAANLKSLLLKIHGLSLADQHQTLAIGLDQWRGSLEQVDDVCIMGVKF